jgi:hypothetical protein
MANPRGVIEAYVDDLGWLAALSVPAIAFGLLFLQSGLDIQNVGGGSYSKAAGLGITGLVLGLVVVPVLALVAWIVTLPFDRSRTLGWTVRAFCLAYAPALIYGFCGLVMNLVMGWNTAIACGITGVLWALSPLVATLNEMNGDRRRLSLVLATLMGVAVLVVWAATVGA